MTEIKMQIRQIVIEIFPQVSELENLDELDIFSQGLTSVNAMLLVVKLQELFGIQFDPSEINIEEFRTITNMVELVKRKKKNRQSFSSNIPE